MYGCILLYWIYSTSLKKIQFSPPLLQYFTNEALVSRPAPYYATILEKTHTTVNDRISPGGGGLI